jgi:predicted ATPase/DNA-binding winged helix-turn-helix (wHTH) protein
LPLEPTLPAATKSDLPGEYAFGTYRLVRKPNRLLQGDQPIPLAQRALMVLTLLVERAGGIISRDELFDTVWRDRIVEPGNLDVQLSLLRRLLGRELIQTVPGRGYRIAVSVTVGGAPLAAPSSQATSRKAPERTNLPRYLTPLIGRDDELADLAERVMQQRLVTIAGPGGVGKTRLAIGVGERRTEDFPDGVWLIDVAPLTDPALIASAIATVLGVALHGTQTPIEAIVAAIAKQRLLLIFDNCEYLAAATSTLIETLLARVAGLSVLVTSQEVLRLAAEAVYRLDPLALPAEPSDGLHDAEAIACYGAIALFVARAQAADRRFRLDAANAALVAAICRALEGLPLALEMAAARLSLLGVKGLNQRLAARLDVLAVPSRIGEGRHRTLLAMVEWSHGLLDPSDQQVFRRLAVFRGGFSLDAAIAVAGADEAESWATIDALERLIDKSLVTVEPGGTPRYRLLETLRLFAAQALTERAESERIAERHAQYFTAFFDGADVAREMTSGSEWESVYPPEIDNVRAALDWTLADPRRKPMAHALVAVALMLWNIRGLYAEGRYYFDRVESVRDEDVPDSDRARLLRWGASIWIDADPRRGLTLLERSVAIYRRLNQEPRLALAQTYLGRSYIFLGRYAEARTVLCEAEVRLSIGGYNRRLSTVMGNLAYLATKLDDADEARRCFNRALDLARVVDDAVQEGHHLASWAEFEFEAGAVDVAIERGRDSVRAFRSVHHRPFLGWALSNLAAYLVARDNVTEVRAFAEEALPLLREEGGNALLGCFELWAVLGGVAGQSEEAARLAGYVDAGYRARGTTREATERYLQDRLVTLLQDNLSPIIIRARAAEGARWSEDQAVTFVYDHLMSRSDDSARS